MKTRKPLPTFESFDVNEARASAKSLLQSVIKGETKEIEGIKMSKEMAQGYADWLRMSPYGKKFDTLPFHKLFKASFDWGIHRYVDKSLSKELEDLKKVAKTFESVNEAEFNDNEVELLKSKDFGIPFGDKAQFDTLWVVKLADNKFEVSDAGDPNDKPEYFSNLKDALKKF